jgi:hypothetical protein
MKLLLISLLLVLVSSSALSEELGQTSDDAYILSPEDEPFVNLSFGPSPYGILGIELQKGKHSVGIGFPERVSYRYYSAPYGDSLFYGLYAGRYKQVGNDEKKFDGVIYKNEKNMDAGFGIGHMWQWSSGWNVAASFSIHYMYEEYTYPGQPKKKETSVILFPGINVGFKF